MRETEPLTETVRLIASPPPLFLQTVARNVDREMSREGLSRAAGVERGCIRRGMVGKRLLQERIMRSSVLDIRGQYYVVVITVLRSQVRATWEGNVPDPSITSSVQWQASSAALSALFGVPYGTKHSYSSSQLPQPPGRRQAQVLADHRLAQSSG